MDNNEKVAELYFSLTEKYNSEYGDKTIVLMLVGSFFEVYALKNQNGNYERSSILDFSDICELNIAFKKPQTLNNMPVVMAGFKDIMLDKYLKKLQNAGYTIPVYIQEGTAPNITRKLGMIVGPGTSFTEKEKKYTNNITCIWFYKTDNAIFGRNLVIGIANIDIFTGDIVLSEYNNTYYHNPSSYDDLERFISIYQPIESIIIHNMDDEIINDIIQFIGLNSKKNHLINLYHEHENVTLANNCTSQVYQKKNIAHYFSNINQEVMLKEWEEYPIAAQALCYILDFVGKHNPNMVKKLNIPRIENKSDRLMLANHSLKQLNMIDDSMYQGKYSSVNKLLNMCITPMGKRRFDIILLNPIKNVNQLNESYEITQHACNINAIELWKSHLNTIKDLEKLKRKALLEKITPKDFYNIHESITSAQELFKLVKDDVKLKKFINKPNIHKNMKHIVKFIEKYFILESCINIDTKTFDKCCDDNDNFIYFINKGINDDLDTYWCEGMDSEDKLESIRVKLEQMLIEKENKTSKKPLIKYHQTANTGLHLQ